MVVRYTIIKPGTHPRGTGSLFRSLLSSDSAQTNVWQKLVHILFVWSSTGVERGEFRSSANQGSIAEGLRVVSRAACGGTSGFLFENHSKVLHQDREDSGRLHSRTSSFAASHGEFGTVAGRSCFQRAGASAAPTGANGCRKPRRGGSKFESPCCRVTTRARSQAGGGREQGQESLCVCCPHPRWIWPQFTLVQQVRVVIDAADSTLKEAA